MIFRSAIRALAAAFLLAILLFAATRLLVHFAWTGIAPAPVERLWKGSAPLAVGATPADIPTLSVFLPATWHSTGTALLVCPGGAYKMLQSSYEGDQIARWLNSFGVAAFVLKYRIAPRYRHPAPLLDAARALRFIRFHAHQYGIQPDRIGIIGFSAGGHLASTLLTHFDPGNPNAADPIDAVSSRPDFGILGYPIITLETRWTHAESAANLLGPDADPALTAELSNDIHVTANTPSTFLFHTNQDRAVPAENSARFYLALRQAGVPSELHIFAVGPHGAGLANGHGGAPRVPTLMAWQSLAESWLAQHWLKKQTWSYSILFRI